MENRFPDLLDENVGMVIKMFREFMVMTQTQLAKASGVSQAYISQIENGRRNKNMSITNLQSIAKALEFDSLSQMIDLAEEKSHDDIQSRFDDAISMLKDTKKEHEKLVLREEGEAEYGKESGPTR